MKWLKLLCHKLGSCGDTYVEGSNTSIFGLAQSVYNHHASNSSIIPDDCTTIDIVTSATEKTFGDFIKIIDVNSGSSCFSVHWLDIVDITENGNYVLEIHSVNPESIQESLECLAQIHVGRIDVFTRSYPIQVQMRNVKHGNTIAVRGKKSGAGAGTVKVVCTYHSIV